MDLFRFELANGPTGLTGNLFQREHFTPNRGPPLKLLSMGHPALQGGPQFKIKIDAESGFAWNAVFGR